MQQYRRFLLLTVAMLVFVAGTASLITTAFAEVVIPKSMPKSMRGAPLRTNDVGDPDTVWIGHVQTPTGLPGTPGGFGPYKIGRGPRLIGGGAGTSNNGVWTFDHFQGGTDIDSLFGWWPIACPYASVGGSNLADVNRPFFCLDYGNQGNHAALLNSSFGATPRPAPRTFGVTGYWHRDVGNNTPGLADTGAVIAGPDVEWAPIGGGASAWCGLRGHGDQTSIDLVANGGTGNAFNQSVLEYNGNNTQGSTFGQIGSDSPLGTDKNFPGYGSQWDQMLYRDVSVNDGQPLSVQFQYRTNMSTDKNTASATRCGWFNHDPLLIATAATVYGPNFVSSSNAVGNTAPVDSFMVYVGVPVEVVAGANNDFQGSDGLGHEIYDRKRRWFSEVIRIDQPHREILTVAGVNATTSFNQSVANSIIQPILDAQAGANGLVRIVFRVKTNRGFDDEDNSTSGFSSGTAGAAIVDNVVLNGWAAANGDFESTSSIDNRETVAASAAWKSTGKPPGAYFHSGGPVGTGDFVYQDPCGSLTSPTRLCNMAGRVVSGGNADNNEKPGGEFGENDQDRQNWLASPTINFRSTGPGDYNGMGIDAEIADASGDYMVDFDLHTAVYQFAVGNTANGIRCAWQSYPARQPNGLNVWGEVAKTLSFSSYDGNYGCYDLLDFGSPTFLPPGGLAKQDGVIVTSNANGIPDSVRVYFEHLTICFRRPVGAAECSPNTGVYAGGWIDNIAIALIDAPPPPGVAVQIWDVFNDAFPVNDGNDVAPNTAAFDTLAAQIRSGFNTGRQTGNLTRQTIPGDTALVDAGGTNKRADLVFRILPGVGNYRTIGNRSSGLRKRPDQGGLPANAVAIGDGTFWGEYLSNNGSFGTPGGHGGLTWNPDVWNSARMDTVEINFFPANSVQANLGQLRSGSYQTTYHESDPKFATLGLVKNRCFVSNINATSINMDNVNCGNGTVPSDGGSYPPAWTGGAGSGFNSSEIAGLPGRTREYTKILPDGQLTAGAHLQYFFRKSDLSTPTVFEMLPDTHVVFPQRAAGQFDGLRWYHNSVLPDRWKDNAFGGGGMACMLVVELGDRRQDELFWVSMADSIGLTAANRRGAHNGWKARGDQPLTDAAGNPVVVSGDPTIAVAAHGGQPGTAWDNFAVVAGESNVPAGRLGSRVGPRPSGQLTTGKFSNHGPSEAMLLAYYRTIVFLAEDLGASSIGPIPDQTDDDIGLLTSFMTNPAPVGTTPRALIMIGRDLVEGQDPLGGGDHPTFFPTFFGTSLRDPDYRALSGVAEDVPDLLPQSNINNTGNSGNIYGVFSPCFFTNDVYNVESGVPTAQVAVYYENLGASGPYVAGVYAPEGGARIVRTLVEGWSLQNPQGTRNTLERFGASHFWLEQLSKVHFTLNCGPGLGAPSIPVDVGDNWTPGSTFVNFMNLKSSNPMRSGEARIAFGIVKTEKVEVKVYDVSGRLVKTVANRTFPGGREHVVTWDGTDDEGNAVARGVYFYQLRSPSFTSQKKLAVLKN